MSLPRILFRTGQAFGRERILYIDKGLVVVNKPSNFCAQYDTSNIDGINGTKDAAKLTDDSGKRIAFLSSK
jgi:23S rRNA-/tRNA-specific pseudouridylate synthase